MFRMRVALSVPIQIETFGESYSDVVFVIQKRLFRYNIRSTK